MSRLAPEDREALVEAIANRVAEKQDQIAKSFWIEAEAHYKDHLALREVVGTYKKAQGYFWRIMLGFAVVGSVLTTGVYAVYSLLKLKS